MVTKIISLILIIKHATNAYGFNITHSSEENRESYRNAKFLFDNLFGLEIDDDIGSNDLKSCDCGKY
jgi:hypothetical protein